MRIRINRDVLAGVACLLMSMFVLWQGQDYSLGSLRNMGPGYMPRVLGLMLAGLGVLIIAFSVSTVSEFPKINIRALVFVTIGILVFSYFMNKVGLYLSTIMLVFICGLSERKFHFIRLSGLSLALCIVAYLVFILGLRMPIRLFPWSF